MTTGDPCRWAYQQASAASNIREDGCLKEQRYFFFYWPAFWSRHRATLMEALNLSVLRPPENLKSACEYVLPSEPLSPKNDVYLDFLTPHRPPGEDVSACRVTNYPA